MKGGGNLKNSGGSRPISTNTVSFNSVTIYEFPIRMGENPACSAGCPIALDGFEHTTVAYYDLDEFKENERQRRRHRKDFAIPADVRTKMLIQAGYQFEDIVLCTTKMLSHQNERQESLAKTDWEEVKSIVFRLRLPVSIPNPLTAIKRSTRGAKTA